MSEEAAQNLPPITPKTRIVNDAFHGTYEKSALAIVGEGFSPSNQSRHLLGFGVYFYHGDGAKERAHSWILLRKHQEKSLDKVRVIQATIDLGKCLDLRKYEDGKLVKECAKMLMERMHSAKTTDAAIIDVIVSRFHYETVVANKASPPGFKSEFIIGPIDTMICVKALNKILAQTLLPSCT